MQKNKRIFITLSSITIAAIITLLFFFYLQNVPENELWETYTQLTEANKDEESIEILQKILRQNPDNSIALNIMAVEFIKSKKFVEAEKYLLKAKVHAPEHKTTCMLTMIALTNMNDVLVTFRIFCSDNELSIAKDDIEYNLIKLKTY